MVKSNENNKLLNNQYSIDSKNYFASMGIILSTVLLVFACLGFYPAFNSKQDKWSYCIPLMMALRMMLLIFTVNTMYIVYSIYCKSSFSWIQLLVSLILLYFPLNYNKLMNFLDSDDF